MLVEGRAHSCMEGPTIAWRIELATGGDHLPCHLIMALKAHRPEAWPCMLHACMHARSAPCMRAQQSPCVCSISTDRAFSACMRQALGRCMHAWTGCMELVHMNLEQATCAYMQPAHAYSRHMPLARATCACGNMSTSCMQLEHA